MSRQISGKLKIINQKWPLGTVATYPWLLTMGIYRQLVDRYVKSGWLERCGQGALKRTNDDVQWPGCIYAIQKQMHLPCYIGGKTALELQGYSPNVPLGNSTNIWIFGNSGQKLPAWFKQNQWKALVNYKTLALTGKLGELGLTSYEMNTFSVLISAPERAFIELLHLVPQYASFENTLSIMEGLITLRPSLVQNILDKTTSIKVKRLFFYLASQFNHPWLNKIDESKIDFGQGTRSIVPGGQWNSTYNIIIPKSKMD